MNNSPVPKWTARAILPLHVLSSVSHLLANPGLPSQTPVLSSAAWHIAGLEHGWLIAVTNYLPIGLLLLGFWGSAWKSGRTAVPTYAYALFTASALLYASLAVAPYEATNEGLAYNAARSSLSLLLGAVGLLPLAGKMGGKTAFRYFTQALALYLVAENVLSLWVLDNLGYISSVSWLLYFAWYFVMSFNLSKLLPKQA